MPWYHVRLGRGSPAPSHSNVAKPFGDLVTSDGVMVTLGRAEGRGRREIMNYNVTHDRRTGPYLDANFVLLVGK